jgi:hypothetical protein
MLTNRMIAKGLIVLQALTYTVGAGVSRADQSVAPSPEAALLAQVYIIGATAKNKDAAQAQLGYSIQKYMQDAPADGREERLAEAMTSLGVIKKSEADSMIKEADAAEARLNSEHLSSQDAATAAVTEEIRQLIVNHPTQGAQYSSGRCVMSGVAYGFLVAGIAGLASCIVLLPTSNGEAIGTGILYGSGGALALSFILIFVADTGVDGDEPCDG